MFKKMKKMKRYFLLTAVLTGLFLGGGCKKETKIAPGFDQAYTRFVMIDAPGSAKLQFYMDGKINANGDSVIRNPDGTNYTPDPSLSTSSLVNYPSGGWTDNAPTGFSGTYGNNYTQGANYAFWPNATDRIAQGPILNGYNYFNWAALPATTHQVSFYGVVSASLYGNTVFAKGSKFLDQQLSLEGGAVQTFFVVNEAPCKLYNNSGLDADTGLSIYSVNEQIDFYSNQFGIVSCKDHPSKLPVFKDSSAYVRFMNITPVYPSQALNANTDSIDVYLAPGFGGTPMIWDPIYQQLHNGWDSVGKEFLVGKGLARFESTVDAPFYEIDLSAQMRNLADTAISPGKPRIPHYFRVLAYPTGHSAATGDQPVGQGDWLAIYNVWTAVASQYPYNILGPKLDSWLIRSDGTYAHPSICTIPIAVGINPYPNTLSTNYLGFRSCIDYIKQGVNSVFYR